MKLGYLIIYVDDVLKTVDFYQQAFGLKNKMIHESKTYAEMETGETILAFASDNVVEINGLEYRKNQLNKKPAGIEVALVTEDVATAYQKACSAGAIKVQEPEEKPWGQIISYVRDLNGCLVEICSPIS